MTDETQTDQPLPEQEAQAWQALVVGVRDYLGKNEFPGAIIVGLDAKNGFVATDGWAEVSAMKATELAKRFEADGVNSIVYTDIDRDGMMQGVNVQATVAMAQASSIPIIASGGITNLDDNTTQAATRVLMRIDKALDFKDAAIHEAALFALDRIVRGSAPAALMALLRVALVGETLARRHPHFELSAAILPVQIEVDR